jgi:predicted Zn finger-like uncharacterized protein
MIISCPNCSTSYQVDPRALGPNGRTVRCAHCSHTWRQAPAAAELVSVGESPPATPPPPVEPIREEPLGDAAAEVESLDDAPRLREGVFPQEEEPEEDGEARPAPRRRHLGFIIGCLVFLLLVAGVAGGLVWKRQEVIAFWPPAYKLYAGLGLESGQVSEGLVIRVNPSRDDENGVPRLVIDGDIVNSTDVALPVPKLIKVELKDANGRVVQTWTFSATTDRLLPGASAHFTTGVDRPNDSATSLSVGFVEEQSQ